MKGEIMMVINTELSRPEEMIFLQSDTFQYVASLGNLHEHSLFKLGAHPILRFIT